MAAGSLTELATRFTLGALPGVTLLSAAKARFISSTRPWVTSLRVWPSPAMYSAVTPPTVIRKLSPAVISPAVNVTVPVPAAATVAPETAASPAAPVIAVVPNTPSVWRRSARDTLISVAVTTLLLSRLSEERSETSAPPLRRFSPLNWAESTIEAIWSLRASTSRWIEERSTFSSWDETMSALVCWRSFVTCSAAERATFTVEEPRFRLSVIVLNDITSDSMTVLIAQIAALSRAVEIFLPVEIWSCTSARLRLMFCRVLSAVMALSLKLMLDMPVSSFGAAPGLPGLPAPVRNFRLPFFSGRGKFR